MMVRRYLALQCHCYLNNVTVGQGPSPPILKSVGLAIAMIFTFLTSYPSLRREMVFPGASASRAFKSWRSGFFPSGALDLGRGGTPGILGALDRDPHGARAGLPVRCSMSASTVFSSFWSWRRRAWSSVTARSLSWPICCWSLAMASSALDMGWRFG